MQAQGARRQMQARGARTQMQAWVFSFPETWALFLSVNGEW